MEIRVSNWPESLAVQPRLVIRTEHRDASLMITPQIIYGDPAVAEVRNGVLYALDSSFVPLRDLGEEERLARRLRRDIGMDIGVTRALPMEEAVFFVQRLESWPDATLIGPGSEAFRLRGTLEPVLKTDDESVFVAFSIPETDGVPKGAESVAAEDVLSAWRQGRSMLALTGVGTTQLPQRWLAHYADLLEDLLRHRENRKAAPPMHLLSDLRQLCRALNAPMPPRLEALQAVVEEFAGIPEAELPADWCGTLRSYQRQGVNWLNFMKGVGLGVLLADDMGLGKNRAGFSRCVEWDPGGCPNQRAADLGESHRAISP